MGGVVVAKVGAVIAVLLTVMVPSGVVVFEVELERGDSSHTISVPDVFLDHTTELVSVSVLLLRM